MTNRCVTKQPAQSSHQIKSGAVLSYMAMAFNIVSGFLYTPWMVRQIGQSDYGLYTMAISIINLFLIDFGITGAITRYISVYLAKGEPKKVDRLLGLTFKLYLGIDAVIFIVLVVLYGLSGSIFEKLSPAELFKFKQVYLIVGLYSLVSFPFLPLNSILSAYERFVPFKLCELLQKAITITGVVVALLLGKGLFALVIINALVNLIMITVKLFLIKRKNSIHIQFRYTDRSLLKELATFSIWMTIISICQRLIINISPSLVGAFSGTLQVSVFSIGLSLEGYVWSLANALNGLFLPKVTRLSTQSKGVSAINELMIKLGRLQFLVMGIIWIGLFVMGKEFIVLWMGNGFKQSYYVALFLLLPSLVIYTQEIAYNYLIAINEIRYRAIDFIATAIICVVLSLILTPRLGAFGAALAAGIGIFIGHVVIMNIIYYKRFHLDIPTFLKECHGKLCLPWLFVAGFAFVIQTIWPVSNLVMFFIKAILVGAVYCLTMWQFGMNSYEKSLLAQIGSRLKRSSSKQA